MSCVIKILYKTGLVNHWSVFCTRNSLEEAYAYVDKLNLESDYNSYRVETDDTPNTVQEFMT